MVTPPKKIRRRRVLATQGSRPIKRLRKIKAEKVAKRVGKKVAKRVEKKLAKRVVKKVAKRVVKKVAKDVSKEAAKGIVKRRLKKKDGSDLTLGKETNAICTILSSLGTSFDFDEVANKVVLELRDIVGFDRTSMGLLDKTREKIMVYALYLDHPSELDAGMPVARRDGGMWRSVHTLEPTICLDMKEEEDFAETRILVKEGIRSYITLPLIVEGQVEGVINFGSSKVGWFNEGQKKLLEPVVVLIARALRASRIEGQLKDSMSKMQLVDRASELAHAIKEDDEFLEKVLSEAQAAFGQFNFVFFQIDEDEKLSRIRYFKAGFQYNALKGYSQSLDKGVIGKVYRTRSAWVVPDATKQIGFVEAPGTVIGAEISAPAIINLNVRGVLSCITPYPFDFKAYEVWVVKQLAEIIGRKLFSTDREEEEGIPSHP